MYHLITNPAVTQKEQQTLISQICHEIGNPLTLIYSTVQLMESRNPNIKEIEHWNQLTEDIKNLSDLFHELSNFNRCDSLHISTVDLYDMLEDLTDSFHAIAKEKNIQIKFDDSNILLDATDYPCDALKIKQILTNLIKNAIEAADESTELTLSLTFNENPPFPHGNINHYVAISVQNMGPAILLKDQNDIFLPFYSTKTYGTGLGLPTARKIAEAHNGKLAVDSNEDRTIFTIYLPIDEK